MMKKIDIEDGLALMSRGFEKVVKVVEDEEPDLGGSFTVDDYVSLHSALFKLCSTGPERRHHARRLSKAFSAALDSHLSSKILPSVSQNNHHHYEILRRLRRSWDRHSVTARWSSRLLNYLDRCYLLRSGLPSLADTATIAFRENVFRHTKSAAAAAVVALVEAERDGREKVDAATVKEAAVELFVVMGMGELSVYESDLEAPLLDSAAAFYSREAASWTDKAEIAVPCYVAMAAEALATEVTRVARYLHPGTEPKIVEVVRRELLVAPVERIFHDERFGFSALVRADDVDTLQTMYGLYVEIPEELRRLAELFRRLVEEEGMEAVRGESSTMIARLIEIQKRYTVYVEQHFARHEFFETARVDAFKEFINANPSIIELLVAFCEDILGNGKKMSNEASEDTLDNVVELLSHVKNKDLFVEKHRKNLSNRLLVEQKTMNGDSENSRDKFLVGKMKQKIGDWCTHKLEGMLNDIRISRENEAEFYKYMSDKSISVGDSLSVSVLTAHRWPVPFKAEKLSVPAEMANCIESYTGFYGTKFESRRLTFVYSLGNCRVQGNFKYTSVEMTVTPYQAVVMMLFNDSDELSYSEISDESKINDEPVLRATLHSLSSAKYKILTKSGDGDVFRFNPGFKTKAKRFKIPMPKIVEKEKEAEKKIGVEINNNRRFCIDAAIVRIMKSRKELGYQQLLAQCIDQLKSIFVPDVTDMKKRIDTLIDRDFIERDKGDANLLHYIA